MAFASVLADGTVDICITRSLDGMTEKQRRYTERIEEKHTAYFAIIRDDVVESLAGHFSDPISLAKLTLDRCHTPTAELVCGHTVLSLVKSDNADPLESTSDSSVVHEGKAPGFSFSAALEKEKTNPRLIHKISRERSLANHHDLSLEVLAEAEPMQLIAGKAMRETVRPKSGDPHLSWVGRATVQFPTLRSRGNSRQPTFLVVVATTSQQTDNHGSSSQLSRHGHALPGTRKNHLDRLTTTSPFPTLCCWARNLGSWPTSTHTKASCDSITQQSTVSDSGNVQGTRTTPLPKLHQVAIVSRSQVLSAAVSFYRFQIAAFQQSVRFCPMRASQLLVPMRFVQGVKCPQMSVFVQFLGELQRSVELHRRSAHKGKFVPFRQLAPDELLETLRVITTDPVASRKQFDLRSTYSTWELEWLDVALLAFIEAPLWRSLLLVISRFFDYSEGTNPALDEVCRNEETMMTEALEQALHHNENAEEAPESSPDLGLDRATLERWAEFVDSHEDNMFILRRLRAATSIPFIAGLLFQHDEGTLCRCRLNLMRADRRPTMGRLLWALMPIAHQTAVLAPINAGKISVLVNKDIAQRQFVALANCRSIGEDAAFHLAYQCYDRWFTFTKQQLESQRQKRLIAAALDRRFLTGNMQLKYFKRWVAWALQRRDSERAE